jgi:hypothetical protein
LRYSVSGSCLERGTDMQAPSDFTLFVIMFVAVLGMLGVICAIGWISEHWHEVRQTIFTPRTPAVFLSSTFDRGEVKSGIVVPVVATTTDPQNNNGIATPNPPQGEGNELLLRGRAEALAAMVKAEKIGETEGLKIVFKVSPSSTNPRYQVARSLLKEELARLEPGPQYRPVEVAPGPTTITRPKNGW